MKKYMLACVALLSLVSCKPEAGAPITLAGTSWVAEDIAGKGIIDNSHITIAFDDAGRVSGHSGCNRYTGAYAQEGGKLSFPTAMASTRMACLAEAVGNQEHFYLTTLSRVDRVEVTPDGALVLKTPDGDGILFRAEEPAASGE